jgi:hypothetical protein
VNGPLRRQHWARFLLTSLDRYRWENWIDTWTTIGETYAESQGVRFEGTSYADETPLVEHSGTIDG